MEFIDTNIFIRYFTRDDPVKAQACFDLFQRAKAGEVSLTTTEAVIAEVVYVLSSPTLYNLPRADIRARFYPILALRGLKLANRRVYLRALDLYAAYKIDFTDALLVAQMERQKIRRLYSYDGDFDDIGGVERIKP